MEHVSFTGPIYDFKAKMNAYASCDVFVLPSSYEGTSQALFEAMSQAKPIVSTKRGGIPYQVSDGKEALLVEYNDSKALGKAILTLLDDKKLAEELGSCAHEKVKNFVYSKLVRQIEEIYLDALKENKRGM